MTSPLTFHFQQQELRRYSFRKEWWSQKPPYTLRLPCRLWYAVAYDANADSASWAIDENNSPLGVQVRNKARERLVNALGNTSQLGASIAAEWRGSVSMIQSRALQLFRFTRDLKRGRLKAAAGHLGLMENKRKKPSGKQKAKDFGSLWLEYSYGWAPLVSDIYTATEVISRPLPNITIKGKASNKQITHTVISSGGWTTDKTITWSHKCQMIADVKVTNPNLFLNNQLGLTNPASWILEGIPFSFIVDWFSNLSQWVSQLTDFLGCDLIEPMTTNLVEYRETIKILDPPGKTGSDKGFYVLSRTSGIPSAKLQFGYEIPSWKRGLNAISLLTQALRH